jgi:hypothetical protein
VPRAGKGFGGLLKTARIAEQQMRSGGEESMDDLANPIPTLAEIRERFARLDPDLALGQPLFPESCAVNAWRRPSKVEFRQLK